MPDMAKKCINSWKKKCPDYEIIEWNEDSFDISSSPLYVRQAYEAKKWAFVTDYVRLWAMTQFGGICMDTDVEVVRPLNRFLEHQAFSGFEDDTNIPTGIMACEKGFPLFEEFLHYYDDASFFNPDGSINYTTNVVIMTEICLRHGLQQNGQYQVVDGFALYPRDVFCPLEHGSGIMRKSRQTTTIHWFSASWHSPEERKRRALHRKKARKMHVQCKIRSFVHFLIHLPNYILLKLLGSSNYERFKNFLRKE
jgi:mannosyltransferase OCH1-like enzyme